MDDVCFVRFMSGSRMAGLSGLWLVPDEPFVSPFNVPIVPTLSLFHGSTFSCPQCPLYVPFVRENIVTPRLLLGFPVRHLGHS